jgi:hypothetical protein
MDSLYKKNEPKNNLERSIVDFIARFVDPVAGDLGDEVLEGTHDAVNQFCSINTNDPEAPEHEINDSPLDFH